MKHITFYFDVISPYAYLAFEKMPLALEGISYSVTYKPVLFGAILQHFGQLGPAEIAPKRLWTYRHIQWLAKRHDVSLQMPASHPFNPIALLRLALACGQRGACNRYTAQQIFEHVWHSGQEASDVHRLQQLTEKLQASRRMDDADVKAELKSNTDAAIAQGVFGVPMMQVDDQLFWGFDALPMLRAYMLDDAWFSQPKHLEAEQIAVGAIRKK